MGNEFIPEAEVVLAETKAAIAKLGADAAKVKAFWADYKFYLVAFVIMVVGMVAGYHLHA